MTGWECPWISLSCWECSRKPNSWCRAFSLSAPWKNEKEKFPKSTKRRFRLVYLCSSLSLGRCTDFLCTKAKEPGKPDWFEKKEIRSTSVACRSTASNSRFLLMITPCRGDCLNKRRCWRRADLYVVNNLKSIKPTHVWLITLSF